MNRRDFFKSAAAFAAVAGLSGKRALADGWADVTDIADPGAAGYRFFKVKVKLP